MLKWFHFCFIHTVILLQQIIFDFGASLTHSRWRALSYRNQSIDVLWKSVDWFLYDRDFPYERAKLPLLRKKMWEIVLCVRYAVGKVLIHDEILRFQVVLFFIVHRNTFVKYCLWRIIFRAKQHQDKSLIFSYKYEGTIFQNLFF